LFQHSDAILVIRRSSCFKRA